MPPQMLAAISKSPRPWLKVETLNLAFTGMSYYHQPLLLGPLKATLRLIRVWPAPSAFMPPRTVDLEEIYAFIEHLCRSSTKLETVEIWRDAGEDETRWREGLERVRDETAQRGRDTSWWCRVKVVGVGLDDPERARWRLDPGKDYKP